MTNASEGGAPADRVAAQAFSAFDTATVVTVARNAHPDEPIGVTVTGPVSATPPTDTSRFVSKSLARQSSSST